MRGSVEKLSRRSCNIVDQSIQRPKKVSMRGPIPFCLQGQCNIQSIILVTLNASIGYYFSRFCLVLEAMTVCVPFALPAGFGTIFSGLFLSESLVISHHLTNDISTSEECKDDQIENYKY